MVVVSALSGRGHLSHAGKLFISYSYYERGKQFVGAAILCRRQLGFDSYVVLHLLCTGMEVLLKGLLLFHDFDGYKLKIKKFGHNLETLAMQVMSAYNLKPLEPKAQKELKELNKFYSSHLTRYGGIHDIFIDSQSISRTRVFRRLCAAIRLCEREIRKRPEIVANTKF